MLVLTRKKRESVVINDNIEVFVVGLDGDRVRLGFKAPDDVPIYRREVWDAINNPHPPEPT